MVPSEPEPSPPRRILMAVTGLSPQVVTETLYALAVASDPAWIPDEIQLITTAEGAKRARLALLSEKPGWFRRLLQDHSLPSVQFGPQNIHLLKDALGKPLSDIRTPEDNKCTADFITERVREITDMNSELHVSIAGGRKTMGYYLGYALSLFGRPQDRLSHVLVSEPFESCWDFFYPTPYSQVITTRDSKLADTADAEVTLAQIPFVSLRGGLPKRLQKGHASFSQTVEVAQRALQPAELIIDLENRRLSVAREIVCLPPADMAFYSLFARRRKEGKHHVRWTDPSIADEYLGEYARIVGQFSSAYESAGQRLKDGATKEWFEERKSKTNGQLKNILGETLAGPYLIESKGGKPKTCFGLALKSESIRFGLLM